ncbi:MAG: pilin [Patescibacteria group bacterium]|nr:pilin [Patescibacteria group bacterium]
MKHLLFPLILMVVILTPIAVLAASASTLNCGDSLLCMPCYDTPGGCGTCDIVAMINKIVRLILMLAGVASLLMFVWAGLEMIISAGSPDKIKSARTKIIGSLTGILIIYFAWVGVNLIIEKFTANDASVFSLGGKWNKLECISEPAIDTQSIQQNNGSVGTTPPITGNSCLGFQIFGIKSSQCQDVSPSLAKFLAKIYDKLPKTINNVTLSVSDIIITSISDNHGLVTCRDHYLGQCPNDNKDHDGDSCCYHANGSCHYGNNKKDGSYAIDIQNLNSQKAAILKILVEGNGGKYYPESTHIHISTNTCPVL